ncbi:cytochrome b562 [Porticoccus sp. W117]|uniref:cytochrome b562 n=1 Tax=Porticoccus sp. W117 TaxID=3054777 RepID=UPI002591690A|nr:cytochrome b562 [Porticoccus sp. W117]MDM3872440.1 cytochrome b562 [Porticoccus sp. W117]
MQKFVYTLSIVLLLSSPVFAPNSFAAFPDEDSVVSKNFKQVGRALRGMRSAETAEDVAKILKKVKKFSSKNRDLIPTIMVEGTPQVGEYQKGMDEFLAQVDKALALAEAGDKDGATAIVKKFRDIKKGAHDHFNVEWRK